MAELVDGRNVVERLDHIAMRWRNTDGRIVPPSGTPDGATRVLRFDVGATQLLSELSLGDELDRVPTASVYVALGAGAWADKPPERVVDLSAPGLQPAMFTAPAPEAGEWFVRLGSRAACKLPAGDPDGTVGQAARLRVLLDRLATLGSDLVVVGVAGAGHACREAAAGQLAVSEVVTLGTPLRPGLAGRADHPARGRRAAAAPPAAPAASPSPSTTDEREDADLRLARGLVDALMELVDPRVPGRRPGPGRRPRRPRAQAWRPRRSSETSARNRSPGRSPPPSSPAWRTGPGSGPGPRCLRPPAIRAGVRFVLPDSPEGSLRVRGDGVLTLIGLDVGDRQRAGPGRDGPRAAGAGGGVRPARLARLDPDGRSCARSPPTCSFRWAAATAGTGRVVLHDARVLSQSWEQLVISRDDSALVPEAPHPARGRRAAAERRRGRVRRRPRSPRVLDAFAVTRRRRHRLRRRRPARPRPRRAGPGPAHRRAAGGPLRGLGRPRPAGRVDLVAGTVHLDAHLDRRPVRLVGRRHRGPAGLTGTSPSAHAGSIGPGAAAGARGRAAAPRRPGAVSRSG